MKKIERKESEWEDVLGSGELLRRIEKKGNGERPVDEHQVHINVRVYST